MATYNVRLMDGTFFTDVADNVMFQMLEQLSVRVVESYETGEILYQSKAAKAEDVKVSGITRAKNFMVVKIIHEAHDDVSYVEEGLTEKAAKEWLSLTPEQATLYAEDIGILCKVSVFEKNDRGDYIEVVRKYY